LIRLPGAHNQKGIHKFLFQIAISYKEQKIAVEFIIDLLGIKTPELFAVHLTEKDEKFQEDHVAVKDFAEKLQKFIKENQLKHQLLSQMEKILVRNIH